MRYHTVFYASLLPASVFAQSTLPVPSRDVHYPGVPLRGTPSHGNNFTLPNVPSKATEDASSTSIRHHKPTGFSTGLSPKQAANSYDDSKHSSATGELHRPYTKPIGAIFANYTVSHSGPTGTGALSGLGKPAETGSITFASGVKPVASSTGKLPIPVTKGSGPHFYNSTVVIPYPVRTNAGTGVSPGFAKPTAPESHTRIQSTSKSSSGRAPFTKSNGYHFANSTSEFALPTGSGHVRPTGASSGFAKPTNTRNASGFPTASGHPSYTKPSRPQSNSTSTRVQSPSAVLTAGVYSTIISTATVIPIPSGHLPYTKSSGYVFWNSTATRPATGTGVLSTKPSATAPVFTGILSTYILSAGNPTVTIPTGTAAPYSKPVTALFVNSTSSVAPTGSSPTGILGTGISSPVSITVSSLSFSTFSASSTSASIPTISSLESTTVAAIPTTMITRTSPTTVIASTGFVTSTFTHSYPSHVIIPQYYQCGGINFKKGKGACAKGTVCKKWNPYYHQCVDERYA